MQAIRPIVSSVIATSLLLAAGIAQAEPASRAAFSVAVLLHTSMRQPHAVAQLCAQQRPMEMAVGATIRIECPAPVVSLNAAGTAPASAAPQRPEVLVSF